MSWAYVLTNLNSVHAFYAVTLKKMDKDPLPLSHNAVHKRYDNLTSRSHTWSNLGFTDQLFREHGIESESTFCPDRKSQTIPSLSPISNLNTRYALTVKNNGLIKCAMTRTLMWPPCERSKCNAFLTRSALDTRTCGTPRRTIADGRIHSSPAR